MKNPDLSAGTFFGGTLLGWGVMAVFLIGLPNSLMGQESSGSAVPRLDATGQPFRWAPMSRASRSLTIHLNDRYHYAFDTANLRVHSVWKGEGLELYGPPYTHRKIPFIAQIRGERLWGLPPLVPWFENHEPDRAIGGGALFQQFRSLHTLQGRPTLMFDLFMPSRQSVRVQLQPRMDEIEGLDALVQRFEVSSTMETLSHLVLAESGTILQGDEVARSTKAVLVRTERGYAAVWHRGLAGLKLQSVELEVNYDEEIITEESTESGRETVNVSGRQSRVYLVLPPQSQATRFETCTVSFDDLNVWGRLAGRIMRDEVLPGLIDPISLPDRGRDRRKSFAADQGFPKRFGGDAYWRVEPFPVPAEADLLVGGMDWTKDGDLAVCTWPGEVYLVKGALGPVDKAVYHLFAEGLNEPLGLKVYDDKIHVVQKGELLRLEDLNADSFADLYVCINDDWGYSGNYHAYAFGPLMDELGRFYVFTCGQRGRWDVPFVGWAIQISPDGNQSRGFASGLRVPNGVGFIGEQQDLFAADNQGNWVGTCKFSHIKEGLFYGFPSGRPAPKERYEDPKDYTAPAVWLPRNLSPSASDFVEIKDERFGPFRGQVIMGDFQKGHLMRIQMEKVKGEWQGAVWPFLKGFLGAVNRMVFGPDGNLYVGGCKRTWSTPAPMEYSLERVSWTGRVPFEIQSVHVEHDGFTLAFTQPVSRLRAGDPENYIVSQFNYKYHQPYGSAEHDHDGNPDSSTELPVQKAVVSEDNKSVRLRIDGLKTGFVTSVRAYGLVNENRERLRNDTFYYTLNHLPD